ncbi:MAG: hypothetical protein KZQ94_21135, partial [Candidatus Thiodiazotropha sp. (ex Troendleina suluensis)]|nr:hypothetical protein [Candidatus Thiodiazotropha sp. (ex Troendleina suluensis)]
SPLFIWRRERIWFEPFVRPGAKRRRTPQRSVGAQEEVLLGVCPEGVSRKRITSRPWWRRTSSFGDDGPKGEAIT